MDREHEKFPGMDSEVPTNAISLYDQNGSEEFPVLKAFQQYIDAEQAKARKRLVCLGIFFCILMGAVIVAFVAMLMHISERNQLLNDRLFDFAMKERDRSAPVVVQPPVQQDNSAILSLASKLEEMQKKLLDSQKQVQEAEAAAKKAVESAKGPTPEELEIQRLKALLATEKEKAAKHEAEEKRLKKEAELEAYRRKHYPELYAPKPKPESAPAPAPVVKPVQSPSYRNPTEEEVQEILNEIDGKAPSTPTKVLEEENIEPTNAEAKPKVVVPADSISETNAISYFGSENEPKAPVKTSEAPAPMETKKAGAETPAPQEKSTTVEAKGLKMKWQIPE